MERKYKVIAISWGGVKKTLYDDLTYAQAVRFCDENNWEWSPDGGYVWDLDIDWYTEEV